MNYKKLIVSRIETLKNKNPQFKQTRISERMGIEASYLSRFLTDPKVSFSDDLLFRLLKDLRFSQTQIEQVFIYREIEKTLDSERKEYLKEKLQLIRLQTITGELQRLKLELTEMMSKLNA